MTDEIKKRKRRTRRAVPINMILRGRVYYANFMKNGRRIRKRLSTDLDAATEMLNALVHRADKADFALLDNRYPWADLRKEFRAWAKLHIRRWQEYEADLDKFEEFYKPLSVAQVTPGIVNEFRTKRLAEGVTARTINRQVGTIRNMLGKGVEMFKMIASNPLAVVKRIPEGDPTKVRRALTPDEVAAIFKYSRPEMIPVWRLYATTGMRKMELVTLLFSDIDWDGRAIVIRASVAKGKKSRDVPLDDQSFRMLRMLFEESAARPQGWDRAHVFVNHYGRPHRHNLLRKFYGTCKRAGIADAKRNGAVDLHALRTTFITLAIRYGANPKAVQDIVGHATLDMTINVYTKTNDRSKRDAISALPFAAASSPDHLLSISGPTLSQIYPNYSEAEESKVG